ncbi:MAG: zinc dependent phospholipase C family protein [Clostridia bacterium]|nr:zinc dependent phospholipase C family protein [Clostridia bacterium]
MPEIAVHYFFGERVLTELPKEIRDRMHPDLYRTGVRGPDPLGVIRFWRLPVWKKFHGRSSEMHKRHSGKFFRWLSQETMNQTGILREQLFSYECGFLTHYFLDSACHPYVIYRTGFGKDCAGNHRSLEHAMDRLALARNGMKLTDRPISRKILARNSLPEGMKQSIDAVYAETFGWKDAWYRINQALRDEIRFVRIIEDPRRILARFAKGGTPGSLSYAEKAYAGVDIENEEHREWRYPYEEGRSSTKSLAELTEEAAQQAGKAIRELYLYLQGKGPYPETIGNRSYESGLDIKDARNQTEPQCEIYQR